MLTDTVVSSEMFRRTFAEINIPHLLYNWDEIKKIAGDDRFICPMVKANAYGHGDVEVARALDWAGARGLGVCLIEEGLILRSAGIKTDILVFRGFDKRGAEKILEYQLTPVVSTWEQLHYLESLADDPVKVHIKFDTGMNRIGFSTLEAEKIRSYFTTTKKLKLKAILTHFAQGEDAYLENGKSAKQTQLFTEVFDFFKDSGVYAHLLNSGGIASFAKLKTDAGTSKTHYLMQNSWGFRPGLMLYGYRPSDVFSQMNLKPVMSLKSVVNNMRWVLEGESVSYGSTWRAEKKSIVAVVPIGYADGVHRVISNNSHVLFAGQKVPVIGRVCMDFLMLDVTSAIKDIDKISLDKINLEEYMDTEVVLFGFDDKNNFLSAEEMAKSAKTIVWETLTSVGERVPRHFKGLKRT